MIAPGEFGMPAQEDESQPYFSLVNLGQVYANDTFLTRVIYSLDPDRAASTPQKYTGYLRLYSGQFNLLEHVPLTLQLQDGRRAPITQITGSPAAGHYYVHVEVPNIDKGRA
jgi:hypothetical protein